METEVSFGDWVRRRRKALDLTQQQLAHRVGCSLATLQKIERDERRPSRQLATLLGEHLQVPANQRDRFIQVARGERLAETLAPFPQLVVPLPERRAARPELPSRPRP
jgi:transcriptional regulator with XRE-family HTH domain